MKYLVIYDSVFGNTEKVAAAIRDAIGSREDAVLVQVEEMTNERLKDLEILIVGSPTRAFKATKGVTDFLKRIPKDSLDGIKVTAFDTRVSVEDINSRMLNNLVKLFGYAAEPIAKLLVKKGGNLTIQPEGFIVRDTKGPLKDGELERASEWAKKIVQ